MLAVQKGDMDIAHLLIQNGAFVDISDEAGQTALHIAVLGNHPSLIEILLAGQVDLNIADNQGILP